MVSTATPIGREVTYGQMRRGGADEGTNVGQAERLLSLAGGGLLIAQGLKRGTLGGFGLATLGGALVYRGLSGHCSMYRALGIDTSEGHSRAASVAAGRGVHVTAAITIDRPAEELYRAFRAFDQLPRFMRHLVSVRSIGNRSHWVARAPGGMTVQWDAEIINEEPNRLIAWRSLAGSTVSTAGSVHFTPEPGGRGTEVRVNFKYDPPGHRLGSWLAWLFGEEPGQQVRDDLHRFKQLMESGEITTSEGRPSRRD